MLALLASEKPAMLVLDEPTNHLDLDMRMLCPSASKLHRRGADSRPRQDLLEKLVDEFWLVDDGGLTDYTADLNEYTGIKQANHSLTEDDSQTADDSKRSQRQERGSHQRVVKWSKKRAQRGREEP